MKIIAETRFGFFGQLKSGRYFIGNPRTSIVGILTCRSLALGVRLLAGDYRIPTSMVWERMDFARARGITWSQAVEEVRLDALESARIYLLTDPIQRTHAVYVENAKGFDALSVRSIGEAHQD
jgi:hypothetical protein